MDLSKTPKSVEKRKRNTTTKLVPDCLLNIQSIVAVPTLHLVVHLAVRLDLAALVGYNFIEQWPQKNDNGWRLERVIPGIGNLRRVVCLSRLKQEPLLPC